jgi:hypothetical protein
MLFNEYFEAPNFLIFKIPKKCHDNFFQINILYVSDDFFQINILYVSDDFFQINILYVLLSGAVLKVIYLIHIFGLTCDS